MSGVRHVGGIINGDGTIKNSYGDNFTVAKVATGQYMITFEAPFSSPPAVAVNVVYPGKFNEAGNGYDYATVMHIENGQFMYITHGSTNYKMDMASSFVVIGPE
eukprot:m.46932 g.46932  ORF g.46932 m.46932 type:complete len:104 (+) comp33752_c0_seq2:98-409(+)